MKINMSEYGVLTIRPDTPIEAYALKKWCDDSIDKDSSLVKLDKLVIYFKLEGENGQKILCSVQIVEYV